MIRSPLLSGVPGIEHGFGEASDPAEPWPGPRPSWKQVHGTRVATVTAPAQAVGEADGLRTRVPRLPVGVVTADCVPILLARRDGSEVVALHAGWRGTLGGQAGGPSMGIVTAFAREAGDPTDWAAAIGPCAGPCCYEVSEELAADFTRRFGPLLRPRFLDLAAANAQLLRESGFAAPEILRHCTICERDSQGLFRFHSYRRDQTTARLRSQMVRV